MEVEPFENVKNQIGYCGIWCGSCVVGNGTLRELTKRYEETIKNYGLEEWGPKDIDYKQFKQALTSIQDTPPCLGCLKGDGRTDCEIRACAQTKKISDCTMCPQPGTCENLEILQQMRTGARRAGLFVKTEKNQRKQLLEKWTKMLRNQWPSCIILCNPSTDKT